MATIFTKIVRGEIPSYKIAEDEHYYAFLDINPLAQGHTLVIPKQETDYIFDLDPELLAGMMVFAQKIAKALKQTIPCNRIGLAVLGLEVPHAHIHLVPMQSEADLLNFSKKLSFSKEEMAEITASIAKEIQL